MVPIYNAQSMFLNLLSVHDILCHSDRRHPSQTAAEMTTPAISETGERRAPRRDAAHVNPSVPSSK